MPSLEGVVENIIYRNEANGWTVIQVKSGRSHVTATGLLPFVTQGESLRLTGDWVDHPDYGRQMRVTTYETMRPVSSKGIEKYLASGFIRGIGPATAKLLVATFGKQTLDVLESQPELLGEVRGIGPKRAEMIASSYREQLQMRSIMMFLQQYDVSPNLCLKIIRHFGEATQQILNSNPYRIVDEINGVGFQTADRIARNMGLPEDAPERLRCGLRYVLTDAQNTSGHVYLPREALLWQASQLLGAEEEILDNALRGLLIERELVAEQIDETTAIYTVSAYKAEADTARLVAQLMAAVNSSSGEDIEDRISAYEEETGTSFSEEQRRAIAQAVTGGVTIITGGPGTGKTTSIQCIIRLMSGQGEVLLTAPTGRAAKRMSEATGCPAQTIHRLLEFGGEEGGFARSEQNPLKACMIIVDEMSMVDIFLMRSLLRAVRPGTRLVLVGDADQLPSVGAGNVLADLIDSGVVPLTRLKRIFRQAGESMIVLNAHRVNAGEMPRVNTRGGDFFLERKETVADVCDSILKLVSKRLPAYAGLDALRDIQVLSPTRKGEVGVVALNQRLQAVLNPPSNDKPERKRGDTCFRVGDKVMQVKNDYQLQWINGDEEGVGVFNGDMGFIIGIDPEEHTVTVAFDDERVVEYDDETLEELELSYCVSVHKSQGSEFPCVVMPAWNMPPLLMTRNLFYTAITRAKKLVVLVGREACIRRQVSNARILQRYSALGGRLVDAVKLIGG
ncbi:MAG: ATP-dependent RecD-like DNA helicase [Clostridia bacterium]|nr:ATP-dependent RecD-like DNA helicase [Clostridia bacterium]